MAAVEGKETRKAPEWTAPRGGGAKGDPVMVNNSLAPGGLVSLVPEKGNTFTWYGCGPTVYDSAHLGHARNYVTTDVLRRIVEDYFGYGVSYAMNITDVDDKIILRARQNYMAEQYAKTNPVLTAEVVATVKEAVAEHEAKLEKKIAARREEAKGAGAAAETAAKEAKLEEEKLAELRATVTAELVRAEKVLQEGAKNSAPSAGSLLAVAAESLGLHQDQRLGHQFKDNDVIRQHAARFEQEFLEDMRVLGVRPADVLTRVSEYMAEVIAYVEGIVANGFGYVTKSGSVYFDTHRFNDNKDHFYAKLEPTNFQLTAQSLKLLAEGEGSLSSGGPNEKRNPQDFALWKAGKPGEPEWNSPWGMGRPGWHIECSAMSCAIHGPKLDIHSGGVDLKFPHHDNEIAQAEARYESDRWVHYFLHPGHLHINGLKMSKSLKNFITIRQALVGTETFPAVTPRQMRLMFLNARWDATMDFSNGLLEIVLSQEKSLAEFFLVVQNTLREQSNETGFAQNWSESDAAFNKAVLQTQEAVGAALRANFDTNTAMQTLLRLTRTTNRYITENKDRRGLLVRKAGSYVMWILRVFGLTDCYGDYAFSLDENKDGLGGQSKQDIVAPYVEVICKFRNQVRDLAKKRGDFGAILDSCDELRDVSMPPLGVRILDDSNFPFSFVDAEKFMKELEEKKLHAEEQARKKKVAKIEALERDLEGFKKASIHPRDMFAASEEFGQYDEEGKPTHNKDGKELAKAAKKKVNKEWTAQQKKFDKLQGRLKNDPNLLESTQKQIDTLKATLS